MSKRRQHTTVIKIALEGGKPRKVPLEELIRGLPSAGTSILLGLMLDDLTWQGRVDADTPEDICDKLVLAIADEIDRRIPARSSATTRFLLKRRSRPPLWRPPA